jgi:hypothetical protein
MGWTSLEKRHGQSLREFFQNELFTSGTQTILASATTPGVFYAAVRSEKTGEVWALVCLVKYANGRYNFSYKDMDEGMGPCEAGAPARILDLLTPTDSQYANEWRQRCRKTAERKEALSRHGSTIRFAQKMRFGSHIDPFEEDTFTIVKQGRQTLFRSKTYGILCGIPGAAQRYFECVS